MLPQSHRDLSESTKYHEDYHIAYLILCYQFDWLTDLLVYERVTDLDAKSQIMTNVVKVLTANGIMMKKNYLDI